MPARAILEDPVCLKAHMSVMVTASIVARRRQKRQKLVQRLRDIDQFLDQYDGVGRTLDSPRHPAPATPQSELCS